MFGTNIADILEPPHQRFCKANSYHTSITAHVKLGNGKIIMKLQATLVFPENTHLIYLLTSKRRSAYEKVPQSKLHNVRVSISNQLYKDGSLNEWDRLSYCAVQG
jgi:hypothetical protein